MERRKLSLILGLLFLLISSVFAQDSGISPIRKSHIWSPQIKTSVESVIVSDKNELEIIWIRQTETPGLVLCFDSDNNSFRKYATEEIWKDVYGVVDGKIKFLRKESVFYVTVPDTIPKKVIVQPQRIEYKQERRFK